MPYLWHKGKDFQKAGVDIPLMYRMATTEDQKDPTTAKKSRYLWKAGGQQQQRVSCVGCLQQHTDCAVRGAGSSGVVTAVQLWSSACVT